MTPTDRIHVRELLALARASTLREALGVPAKARASEVIDALEAKRAWAKAHPRNPLARWWSRHLTRATRILVHEGSDSITVDRMDDFVAAVRGAVASGNLGETMERLLLRMGRRRGLSDSEVHDLVARERTKEAYRKPAARPDPQDAMVAAIWGANLVGTLTPQAFEKLLDKGHALGLEEDEVRTMILEMSPQPDEDLEEEPSTGEWIPPHLRTADWDPLLGVVDDDEDSSDGWSLAPPQDIDELVRATLDADGPMPDIFEAALDEDVMDLPSEDLPLLELDSDTAWRPNEWDTAPRRRTQKPRTIIIPRQAQPNSILVIDPTPADLWFQATRIEHLARHTAYSTMAVMAGLAYGVVVFLLASRPI